MYLEKSTRLPVTGGIVKSTASDFLNTRPVVEIQGRAERAPLQAAAVAS